MRQYKTPLPWNIGQLRRLLRFGRKNDGPWNEIISEEGDLEDGWLPDENDVDEIIVAVHYWRNNVERS